MSVALTTLEGTVQRLPLNQSSRVGVKDQFSNANVLLWKAATAQFQCALFRATPGAGTLVNDVSNLAIIELVIRKTNAAGTVLVHKTITGDDVDLTVSYTDWLAGNDEQFSFELTQEETNQTVPDSGHLQIYFAIFVTTATHRYLGGFGYGEIIDVGIEDIDLPPPPDPGPYTLTVPLIATSGTYSGVLSAASITSNFISGSINTSIGLAGLEFVDVRWHEADMTGVTDSTTAFRAAITAAQTNNRSVYIPDGILSINARIDITSAVIIDGPGIIQWNGASGGTMMKMTHFDNKHGVGTTRLTLDGNNLAAHGLVMDGVTNGLWDLKIYGWTSGYGLKCLGTPGFTSSYKTFSNLELASTNNGGACLFLSSTFVDPATSNDCHNLFVNTKITHGGTKDAIQIGAVDNDSFMMVRIYRAPGGTGAGVRIIDEIPGSGLPSGMQFFHLQPAEGGWVQPANCSYVGNVYSYMQDNGQPDPDLNGGRLFVINGAGDMSGVRNFTAIGDVFTQNSTFASRQAMGVIEQDFPTTFRSTYLTQGDSAATGTFGGLSWVNSGALVFQNLDNAIIGTNGATNLSFVIGGVLICSIGATGIIPRTAGGTALFARDAAAGPTFTVANNAVGHPFGSSTDGNFSGEFTIIDTSVSGSCAKFLVGGGDGVVLITQTQPASANFTTVKDTAGHSNVYLNASFAIEIQNKSGISVNYRIMADRLASFV